MVVALRGGVLIATLSLFIYLFLAGLFSAHAEQREVVFAYFSRGWLPMELMVGNEPSGIAVDIFKAVMPPELDASVEISNKPRKLLYTETNPVYTRLTAKKWLSTEYHYLFSDPVMPMTNVLYSPAHRPMEYDGPKSVIGKTVGCIKNYTYPKIEMMVAAGKAKRYDVNRVPVLLRMVKEGRVDCAVLDVGEAQWVIRNSNTLKPEDFHVSAQPVDEVQLQFVFNRAPGWEEWLPLINERIHALRQGGGLDEILSRYK